MATRTHDISAQVNGVATAFSTPEPFLAGTLVVYLNGVRQRRDVFFSETGTQTFSTTEPPRVGDALSVQYEVVGAGDVIVFPTVNPSGIDPGRS
jgi:hypothetical protein